MVTILKKDNNLDLFQIILTYIIIDVSLSVKLQVNVELPLHEIETHNTRIYYET
jgi:hypothetical protein